MSDGIKAYYEDLDEWNAFCDEAKFYIPLDTISYEDKKILKEGFSLYKLMGENLIKYLNLNRDIKDLIAIGKKEQEEYNLYLKLKEKYE